MKIMMDMVPNHVHNTMSFYEQSYKDCNNKYHLWFCFKNHHKENIKKQKFIEEKSIRQEKRKKENLIRKKNRKRIKKKIYK
jgi:glycosidase